MLALMSPITIAFVKILIIKRYFTLVFIVLRSYFSILMLRSLIELWLYRFTLIVECTYWYLDLHWLLVVFYLKFFSVETKKNPLTFCVNWCKDACMDCMVLVPFIHCNALNFCFFYFALKHTIWHNTSEMAIIVALRTTQLTILQLLLVEWRKRSEKQTANVLYINIYKLDTKFACKDVYVPYTWLILNRKYMFFVIASNGK